jgi:hypothetical protein
MAPVQMRMSRAQPKDVVCVRDATTNSYLREWQAKPAAASSMSNYESDSYYPNHVLSEPRRDVYSYFRNSDYSDEYYSDNGYSRDPDVDTLYRYFLNSDYCDEYYSDDEYSRDPDVDYNDTICYQPGISTRSSCASGAFHHGISPSLGNVNPIVARVNPWRSRILRTEGTRNHGKQERDTKRSVPNRA